MSDNMHVNEGKSETIEVDGKLYRRFGIRTQVITNKDDICSVAKQYAEPLLEENDVLFISEKMVACTQSRAIMLSDIHPRPLAIFLSKHVYKNPGGIGLAMPETMEMALRECGVLRILFAAVCSVVGKLFGQRGWFYIVAGRKAASIDGPCHYTLPPYNKYVVLGPDKPNATAKKVSSALGGKLVLIVDINDLGGNILGASHDIDRDLYIRILRDNPLGQGSQCTPMGIIRNA
ncbi:MAG: coenzyme F420-0:L-glutamate ligase [Clostridia bacterium]|nr:coenzyme F420-0:L-glutamate ligase [Clostridia bacterium]